MITFVRLYVDSRLRGQLRYVGAGISRTFISFFRPAGGEPGRRCRYGPKRYAAEKE